MDNQAFMEVYKRLPADNSAQKSMEVCRGGMLLYPDNCVTRLPLKHESRRQPNCFRQAESCLFPSFAMDDTEATVHYRLIEEEILTPKGSS